MKKVKVHDLFYQLLSFSVKKEKNYIPKSKQNLNATLRLHDSDWESLAKKTVLTDQIQIQCLM